MSDLFWPGDERATTLMSEPALLDAMVGVESAWLGSLVEAGLAPVEAATDLTTLIGHHDVAHVATAAEDGGNPVIPLVALLRSRAPEPSSSWLHQGLTSQDVLDTALVLALRDILDRVLDEMRAQVEALSALARRHVQTPMIGRTLTQHAVPTTFGAVVAGWIDAVLDAAEVTLDARTRLPAQLGGAVGTLAATTELAGLRGLSHPADVAVQVAVSAATRLGLRHRRPWHTARGPVTRTGDALVCCTDAWGHIATDVTILARPEFAELAESATGGRGGSSTMPHKHNPVLSVLVRRAALAAPGLGATLHAASATTGDQRPAGAWHAEWSTLALLGRRSVVAASQTTELLHGLNVDADQMAATLAAADGVLSERRATAALLDADADPDPATYLGTSALVVAGSLARADDFLKETE